MKKRFVLFTVVLFLMLCSTLVYSDPDPFPDGPYSEGASESGELCNGLKASETVSGPIADFRTTQYYGKDPVSGYWKVYIRQTGDLAESWYTGTLAPIASDLELEGFGEGYHLFTDVGKTFPEDSGRKVGNDPNEKSTISFSGLYTNFPASVLGGAALDYYEIVRVQFSLDFSPITTEFLGEPACWSIHQGRADQYQEFETDCVDCGNIDADPFCPDLSDRDYPYDVNCVTIPILKRTSCKSMADNLNYFCEGVQDVGPNDLAVNTDLVNPFIPEESELPVTVQMPGIPGYGGCEEQTDKLNPMGDEIKDYYENRGRDWGEGFTSAMRDGSLIDGKFSPCCGNSIYDHGTLASVKEGDIKHLARYLCINEHGVFDRNNWNESDGAFVWAPANIQEYAFKIVQARAEAASDLSGDLQFDAVSNADRWYVCGPGYHEGDASEYYNYIPWNEDEDLGTLLEENELLPAPPGEWGDGVSDVSTGGTDGTGDNSDWNNEDNGGSYLDLVDVNNVSSGVQTSQKTPCDKDGDGFDGPWISFRPDDPWFDSQCGELGEDTLCCRNPQEPYDCGMGTPRGGDNNSRQNPGMPEYCDNGIDDNCNGELGGSVDAGTEPCVPEPGSEGPSADGWSDFNTDALAARFICFYEPRTNNGITQGAFAECGGYSLSYLRNDITRGRRQGSVLRTLREFASFGEHIPCPDTSNCAIRYGFAIPSEPDAEEEKEYAVGLFTDNNDILIKDFEGGSLLDYRGIEFYVYFAGNFILDFKLGTLPDGKDPDVYDDYNWYLDVPVIDYVVDNPELGKWLHVYIPFTDKVLITGSYHWYPTAQPVDVDVMAFTANAADLLKVVNNNEEVKINLPEGGQGTFANVIAIDKISLQPSLGDGGDRFCTGTYPTATWIEDRDDNSGIGTIDMAGSFEIAGWGACMDTPGFEWTGRENGRCCGDDNGVRIHPIFLPEGALNPLKENYLDEVKACIMGEPIISKQRFMMLKFLLADEDKTTICTRRNCTYSFPSDEGDFVENPHTDEFKLAFTDVGGFATAIGESAGTPQDNARIMAYDVPLQILYVNAVHLAMDGDVDPADAETGALFTCNLAEYITPALLTPTDDAGKYDTAAPAVLNPPDGIHNFTSCQTKSIYFCSHAQGKDLGWSDVKLFNVSASETNPYNILPTTRIHEKKTFNLIDNGGFESD